MATPSMSSDEGASQRLSPLNLVTAAMLTERPEPEADTRGPLKSPTRQGPQAMQGPPERLSPRHSGFRDDRDSYAGGRGRDPRRFQGPLRRLLALIPATAATRTTTTTARHPAALTRTDTAMPRFSLKPTACWPRPPCPRGRLATDRMVTAAAEGADYDKDAYPDKKARFRSRSPRGRHEE